jgi:hypothetical protein
MKRAFQIFSLILSIIGVLYLVLSYHGYVRYLSLHMYDTETYIKNYPGLEKTKGRVVVAFNATEDNINRIKPSVNSILDQGVRVSDIGLTLPYKLYGNIKGSLKKVLSLYGYNKDYKDSQNFVCSVLREPEGETKIILLEPDIIYGEDFIETIVEKSEKNPDKIIYCNHAILVKPKFFDDKVSCPETELTCKDWIKKCAKNSGVEILEYSGNRKRI